MKAIVLYALFTCTVHAQGPLVPLEGPGPTQKSLQEIWDKLQSVESTVVQQQQKIALLEQQNGILLEAAGVDLPWQFSTVAGSINWNGAPSLAYSPGGLPAIVFRDDEAGSLHYAIRNGTSWVVSLIDGPGYEMNGPCLIFDAAGNPMVAYHSEGHGGGINQGLTIAERDGASWVKTVLVEGNAGFGCDMVLSPSGSAAIAYDDADLNALRLARLTDGSWQFETITSSFNTGRRPSLAFRQDGTPAVAFIDSGVPEDILVNRGIYFAIKDGTSWQVETIQHATDFSNEYLDPSLAFSPDGQPAVTYDSYPQLSGFLNYAIRLSGDNWEIVEIEESADWGHQSTLAFNRVGQAVVGYLTWPEDFPHTPSSLAYAVLEGGVWKKTYAGSLSFDKLSGSSSVVLSPNGQPAIAFYNPEDLTVGFTTRGIFVSP